MWKHHDDIHPIIFDDGFLTNPTSGEFVTTYFQEQWELLIYPAKAFAVALVYAKLIEKHFGDNFFAVLDDPNLLIGDQYFYRYSDYPSIYDLAMAKLSAMRLWEFEINRLSQVQSTVGYFKREFWLD